MLKTAPTKIVWMVFAFVAAAAWTGFSNPAQAGKYYTGIVSGVAAGGYDPVAYFSEGKPVRGSKDIQAKWDGVTWRFSSEENRDKFLATPTAFAPQYGGHCAYAVALGQKAKGNPKNWKIVDGKLYLNFNADIHSRWEKKQASYIKRSEKKWPSLSK